MPILRPQTTTCAQTMRPQSMENVTILFQGCKAVAGEMSGCQRSCSPASTRTQKTLHSAVGESCLEISRQVRSSFPFLLLSASAQTLGARRVVQLDHPRGPRNAPSFATASGRIMSRNPDATTPAHGTWPGINIVSPCHDRFHRQCAQRCHHGRRIIHVSIVAHIPSLPTTAATRPAGVLHVDALSGG